MTALGIAAAAVAALALARLGVSVRYDESGLALAVRVLFVRFRLSPRKKAMPRRKAPRRKKRVKAPDKTARASPGKHVGTREIAGAAAKILGRLRHKLLIKRLVVRYTAPGGGDPVRAAIAYGGISASCAAITALIDGAFRVKEREISARVDFGADKPEAYVSADVSLAVWEIAYVACAILPLALKRGAGRKARGAKRKNILD
ncbi:MAG: DUF2953 domain-containing protein [Oscillospiraceae bacterium]|jgi:hypothetical protein|nr:DUF2953 domain-containing protein [Oscillospiraceae bacterium]